MNFRTQVELPEKETEIRHSEQILLFGSCFAENIGNLLKENKFRCDVNPFGVLYNPLSIVCALNQILERKEYREEDLFFSGGLWHSWMHHSDFSASSSEECLERINSRLRKASEELVTADWLVMTWGTSYVYMHEDMQMVVGNCHKQPDKTFRRSRQNASVFVEECLGVLKKCRKVNPNLKVLFTVSPIRHAKDGMHGNQLSKATLLLAIDEICRSCPNCFYFPSYEIVMDELRDYRFYADDMIHLSSKAVEYIWECFCQCYFSKETQMVMNEWTEIKKAIDHKPFRPDSDAYRTFLSQIVLKMMQMKEKFPYLEVQKEMELCESRLKM
jgi:hypothetical protein